MRAIIYLRKSTDDNRHQKASLDDQRVWATRYVDEIRAKGDQVEVIKIYEEKRTAKEPGRPLFGEMMNDIYTGRADSIITWDIDRLSRNEVDEGTIKWAIRQGKIKQVHTHNSIYTEHELLTMSIFLSLGAEEIAKMRQRVMRRMREMIKEGKVPYRAPYGYKNIGEGNAEPSEEAKYVKRIFELRAEGYGYEEILKTIRAEGSKIKSSSTIETIIKNDFYAGVTRFAGEIGTHNLARIIDSDLFARANGKTRGFYTKNREFPLKGMIFSAETGKMFTATLAKGKHIYYHTHGDSSESIYISQTELIEKFDAVVKTYQIPAELEGEILKAFKKFSRENMTEQTSKVHTHDVEVQKIAQKLSNLDDMRIDGEIDSETYKEKRGKLITDQKKLLKKQEEYIAMEHMNTLTIDETVELIKNLYGTWKTWDISRKVSFIKMAAVELKVDKKKRLLVQQKEVFEDLSVLFVSKWLPE